MSAARFLAASEVLVGGTLVAVEVATNAKRRTEMVGRGYSQLSHFTIDFENARGVSLAVLNRNGYECPIAGLVGH